MEEPTERKTKFRILFEWPNSYDSWHKDIDVLLPLGTIISPFNHSEFLGRFKVIRHEMIIPENLLIIEADGMFLSTDDSVIVPDWFIEQMQSAGWILNAEDKYAYDCAG